MTTKHKEFEAKTADEAIVKAMREFRVPFEDLEIKVISEGSKGLFGLMGQKNAKIIATRINNDPDDEDTTVDYTDKVHDSHYQEEVLIKAQKSVSKLLSLMHIDADLSMNNNNTLEISSDSVGLIIGKHGQTLDALQFILNRIVNRNSNNPTRIRLDAQGYRKKHVEHLKAIALRLGQKVKRTGRSVSLERMNSYDRRIIHLALKNDSKVNTKSIGEGMYKKIIISLRKASKY